MRNGTTATTKFPAATAVSEPIDPEVVEFREAFEARSTLDEIIREGARKMLQTAVEAEVDEFVVQHANRRDAHGKRLVVRNGYLPSREVLSGAGALEAKQPRVRDNSPASEDRLVFSPTVLPPYLRRSKSVDELIPWLYLKGISTGDFCEALQALLGKDAPNLSANVIVRLKEKWSQEYEVWSRRDLSGKHYLYVWADGIYVNVRLEDDANRRQCLLVLMGATSEGKKELIAVLDGYRESEQSWTELLLDLQQRGLSEAPLLAVGDGALGFWAALRKVFTKTREQRCWLHKTANVPNPPAADPKASNRRRKPISTKSGRPKPENEPTGRSITSWRSTRPSTTERASVSRRTETCY